MNHELLTTFKQDFDGDIVLPTDPEYAHDANSFMFTGKPAIILKPQTAQAVAQAILFCKQQALVVSVRSGGHSGAGFSTNEGGAIIDMAHFTQTELLDQEKNRVRVGAGARWGEVAHTLGKYSLAISSGDTKTVGVGGLTLGGGIGWLVRKYGLAIDALVAAEVVTADGRILRASESENSDLFWALRGGGGNFGIVTFFEFEAYEVKKVYSGTIMYDVENLDSLVRGWRDVMRQAPEELTTTFLMMPAIGENPAMAMIICVFIGDEEHGLHVLDPLFNVGTVRMKDLKEKAYADVLEEAHPPQGMKVVVHNGFIPTFSDEAISEIVTQFENAGNLILQIRSIGGAMNRISADATAFAHRTNEVFVVSPSFMPPTATEDELQQTPTSWQAIERFTVGAYHNFFSVKNGSQSCELAFPPATLKKLRTIKQNYDPTNFFNQNCNISPE